MIGPDELIWNVYGDTDRFAIVLQPLGAIPLPIFDGLPRLGDPVDVFTRAVWLARIRQADVAAAIGVSQQAVSRYLNGQSRPQLTAADWQTVVRLAVEGVSTWAVREHSEEG